MHSLLRLSTALAGLAGALLLQPTAVNACGGFFCSAGGVNPAAPVDQSAETIFFDINNDGTITTTVQINYAGEPTAFAWVVPVPSVPQVEDGNIATLQALANNTAMSVLLPPPEPCAFTAAESDSGLGCGDAASGDSGGNFDSAPTAESGGQSPVTVYETSFTSTYEFSVIGAEDASDLVTWLQENDYNVSDNMVPVMQPYSTGGMVFLALKLRADAEAENLAPIQMTYEAQFPMVPLQLTAVAAQPLMGIQIFILADKFFVPADVTWERPTSEGLLFDQNGATNYFDVVARKATEAQGRYFSVEAMTSWQQRRLTRLYTRMSPRFMTYDPRFVPIDGLGATLTVLDFTDRQTLWNNCIGAIPERQPSACAFNYCGAGATCTVKEGEIGCVCPTDQVAVAIVGPSGADNVTCVPAESPYGVVPGADDPDPCITTDCGDGICVVRGGFPTCACNPGAVARVRGNIASCGPGGGELFGPGAGTESAAAIDPTEPPRAQFAVPAWGPIGLALLLLFTLRRRRATC